MFVGKEAAAIHQSPNCVVREYGGTPNLDLAVAEISGKYPEDGWARNREVDMTYYVIGGGGKFYFEEESYDLHKGDLVMVEKGKWYRVEGNLEIVMASSPAWSPEQYETK